MNGHFIFYLKKKQHKKFKNPKLILKKKKKKQNTKTCENRNRYTPKTNKREKRTEKKK